jgi:hypothetical protein
LFLKLTKQGRAVFVDKILSSHRWHATSLTYSRRWDSVREASVVRVLNLPSVAKFFSPIWELPIVMLTFLAGHFLSKSAFKSNTKSFRPDWSNPRLIECVVANTYHGLNSFAPKTNCLNDWYP